MIVADTDPAAIDALREELYNDGVDLPTIVDQIVPELTGLNPQGTVHAKTVYSAVNIIRRCPPGPIFYLLISNPRFRDVGAGMFALASPALCTCYRLSAIGCRSSALRLTGLDPGENVHESSSNH